MILKILASMVPFEEEIEAILGGHYPKLKLIYLI